MKQKIKIYVAISLLIVAISSCKKFLDTKPSTAYSTVSTVADAQALMDAYPMMNQGMPFYGEASADNYYYPQYFFDNYGIASYTSGLIYLWAQYPYDSYTVGAVGAWAQAYQTILYANTAIEALANIDITNENRAAANNAKGCALTFRGYYFWKLAVTFSKAYNASTTTSDLGIPLRTGTEIYTKLTRANLQDTYAQIINDLTTALRLLPVKPAAISRPSKPSVYGMLAEVYLSMRDYKKAQAYADSSLNLAHDLIDFNALDKNSTAPMPTNDANKEVMIALGSGGSPLSKYAGSYAVDTTLLASYNSNDLRKRFFFSDNGDGTYYLSGLYFSLGFLTAPAVDEMYLTRAECLARAGNTVDAMADLNTLMKNRIDNSAGPFVPYTASSATEALQIILQERRKELAFRDLRWMDIKRLNLEGANIVITRKVSGKTYTLQPNDNRYAIQLPPDVIQISGMQQNPY